MTLSSSEPLPLSQLDLDVELPDRYTAMPPVGSIVSRSTYPDAGDFGDVFGQISWEALFQSDEMSWQDWNLDGV